MSYLSENEAENLQNSDIWIAINVNCLELLLPNEYEK